jgi:aminoglycoside 3-N-acetyltransferase I
MNLQISRLTSCERSLARDLFAMMAEVFEGAQEPLSDSYLDRLLSRDDFWAMAAYDGEEVVGGITAHTLPMTRSESAEVFIFDVAVRRDYQRKGVGRQLMKAICEAAAAAGIEVVFVPADNDDAHALDFYRAIGGKPSPVTLFTFGAPAE